MEPHTQNDQSKKKILIVDDDEGIREILGMCFATEGYSVATASNGKEALEVLSRSPNFGLILLDLMMPQMNGWEFVEAFKKSNYPQIPIILMTAYTDRVKNLDYVKEVVPKPMDFGALMQRVKAYYKP